MNAFLSVVLFMVHIPECKQQLRTMKYKCNTRRNEILHTSDMCCSFITLRKPCNNQWSRCDIACLHVAYYFITVFLAKLLSNRTRITCSITSWFINVWFLYQTVSVLIVMSVNYGHLLTLALYCPCMCYPVQCKMNILLCGVCFLGFDHW